ncbi:helix-turn-helix transcriptional regulator [Nocardia acidivorans]|uniref:helix-turn-helix transcriptional regulator n=1 Tax=Nocardia acidivorans TaxID=404580 RepID=UPI00082B7CAC|nr:AraC family transcriptional regulator [Nocardia acidivorans]
MSERTHPVRYEAGVPVYRYATDPSVPPLSVMRFTGGMMPAHGVPHIHDFPVLMYIAAGSEHPEISRSGDLYVVAPGAVIDAAGIPMDSACGVLFDPAALGDDTRAPWPAWRAHPLLFPFLHGNADGLLRLRVPVRRQPMWENTIAAIEEELSTRRAGFRQAAAAHLTLLLVDVARLADDVVGDLRRSNETVLAEVFDAIEKGFGEPISLRDIARSVGMTPAYLTTLVRRRTGRTVQDWLIERRMTEARRLLSESDLPVNAIARRVGMLDPGYFARRFRAEQGMTPRAWRLSRL